MQTTCICIDHEKRALLPVAHSEEIEIEISECYTLINLQGIASFPESEIFQSNVATNPSTGLHTNHMTANQLELVWCYL